MFTLFTVAFSHNATLEVDVKREALRTWTMGGTNQTMLTRANRIKKPGQDKAAETPAITPRCAWPRLLATEASTLLRCRGGEAAALPADMECFPTQNRNLQCDPDCLCVAGPCSCLGTIEDSTERRDAGRQGVRRVSTKGARLSLSTVRAPNNKYSKFPTDRPKVSPVPRTPSPATSAPV